MIQVISYILKIQINKIRVDSILQLTAIRGEMIKNVYPTAQLKEIQMCFRLHIIMLSTW